MLTFRKEGIKQHNRNECKKELPEFQKVKISSGPCQECQLCGGVYSKLLFKKHRATCQGDAVYFPKPLSLCLLKGVYEKIPADFLQVLEGLNNDDIGEMCRNDETIQLIGIRLFEKDKAKVDKTMEVKKSTRSNMRLLAKLYIHFKNEMKEINKETTSAVDMFYTDNFEYFVIAVGKVSEKEDGSIKYGLNCNPSLSVDQCC